MATTSSIIRKATDHSKQSGATLIFGEPASGKTQLAVETLSKTAKNPLWVAFTNLNGLGTGASAKWDVATPSSWDEYYREIHVPLVDGKLGYDGVAIDGLHVMSQMCLHYVASTRTNETISPQISQNDWGTMGRLVGNVLVQLRSKIDNFIVVAEVLPTEDGDNRIALNRDLYNRSIGQFANKWYTLTRPLKVEGKPTKDIEYVVEKTGAYAVRLKPSN